MSEAGPQLLAKGAGQVKGFVARGSAASAMLLLLWALLGSAITRTPPSTGLLFNLLLFPAFAIVATAMHELGHALAGHLAGLRVVRVSIGVGNACFRFKIGHVEMRVHEFPLGGMTWMVPSSARGIRWRMWVAVLGGPLTNALMLLALLPVLDVRFSTVLVHGRFAPLETWAIAHLVVLVLSLMPTLLPSGAGTAVSDGLALLEIPLMTEPEKERLMNAGRVIAARDAYERRDHEQALEICETGLRRDPDCVALRNVQGCVFLERRQFDRAQEVFAALLADDGLEPAWRDVFRSNLAWSALRLERQEILLEALHHSEQVFRRQTGATWARTTHGAVLVQLGRYGEGIELLQIGLSSEGDRNAQAHDACWLAVAQARLGNVREAERYLGQARELDPDCYSLADAERVVELASRPSYWPDSCLAEG